jgi:hypothetical protein
MIRDAYSRLTPESWGAKGSGEGVAMSKSRVSTRAEPGFVVLLLYASVNLGNPLRDGFEWRVVNPFSARKCRAASEAGQALL